jgi:hypothetical protein
MRIVGPADGLDLASFKQAAQALVKERYGKRWDEYFSLIASE